MKSVFYTCFFFLFFSCDFDDKSSVLPSFTGAKNEVVIVLEDHLWDQAPGDSLRRYLSAPMMGISWNEPCLNVIQIANSSMSRIFKTHRNLLIIEKGPVSKFVSGKNLFSEAQYFAKIIYSSNSDLLALLSQYSPVVLGQIQDQEKKRLKKQMYFSDRFDTVFKRYGYSLSLPMEFDLVYDSLNFSWFEYSPKDKELISGIFVYQLAVDSWSSSSSLLQERNSILKQHVSGEQAGSYMALERGYEPHVSYLNDKLGSLQVRSLWKMENAFMGGASITHFVLDSTSQSVQVFDAFLFNPGKDKRNDLQYLEVVLQTARKMRSDL